LWTIFLYFFYRENFFTRLFYFIQKNVSFSVWTNNGKKYVTKKCKKIQFNIHNAIIVKWYSRFYGILFDIGVVWWKLVAWGFCLISSMTTEFKNNTKLQFFISVDNVHPPNTHSREKKDANWALIAMVFSILSYPSIMCIGVFEK
jgi:hypothetical protein